MRNLLKKESECDGDGEIGKRKMLISERQEQKESGLYTLDF